MSDVAAVGPTQDATVRPKADPLASFFKSVHETMPVFFYEDGTRNSRPYPAMIVHAPNGGRSVTLHLFDPKFSRAKRPIRDGIRFIDDPDLSENERREKGVYDLAPWLRDILAKNLPKK